MAHREIVMNGVSKPSVTQVYDIYKKDFLERWVRGMCDPKAGKCGYESAECRKIETASFGTTVHRYLEAAMKGWEPDISKTDANVLRVLKNVRKAMPKISDNVRIVEPHLNGELFHGSPDLCTILLEPFKAGNRVTVPDQEHVLIDYKIKAQIDEMAPLQGVGYSRLLKEVMGLTVNWLVIIRASKDENAKIPVSTAAFYLPDFEKYWDASFVMYHYLKGTEDER